MRLICVHCDRHDPAPLPAVPPGWMDVAPEPTATPTTRTIYRVKSGATADTFGICPVCAAFRRTAFVPVKADLPPLDPPPDLLAQEAGPQGLLF